MNSAQPKNPDQFFTLKQVAETLNVTVDTLLEWNDENILKPVITPDGKIGYTQNQISKFLYIQQSMQRSQELALNHNQISAHSTNEPPIVKQNLTPKPKNKTVLFGSVFSVFAVALLLFIFSYLSKNEDINSSAIKNSVATNNSIPNQETTSNTKDDVFSISFVSTKDSDNNIVNTNNQNNLDTVFSNTKKTSTTSADPKDDTSIRIPLALNSQNDTIKNDNNYPVNTASNYAVRPNLVANDNKPQTTIDKDGNLNSETKDSNLLSSNLGSVDLIQKPSSSKNNGFTAILVTLSLGTLWLIYILKSQPAYSLSGTNSAISQNINLLQQTPIEKILEIDQKTDGSVVVNYQQTDYKISKPELNSETDLFIQRVLELSSNGTKKIKYDILEDNKLMLDTPLSKIITRLGFVGIKRDMFFPRTSKNKVVFRRYITKSDLDSLNLSHDQIISELTS